MLMCVRGRETPGARIRRVRTERDLKLREVARRAGISPSSLARIEADQVSPNVSTVRRLAAALDLDAHGLLAEDLAAADAGSGGRLDPQTSRLVAAFQGLDRPQRDLIVGLTEELARLTPERPRIALPSPRETDPPTTRTPQH